MRDGVNALENALFEELRNLQSTDPKDSDAVKASIARAKAVEGLAQQITENHNVALAAARLQASSIGPDVRMPKMLEE